MAYLGKPAIYEVANSYFGIVPVTLTSSSFLIKEFTFIKVKIKAFAKIDVIAFAVACCLRLTYK